MRKELLRRGVVVGLLGALVLLGGCAGTVLTGREYDITHYFPLRAGYWWTYEESSTGQQWTAEVVGQDTFAGQVAYAMRRTGAGLNDIDYYRSTVDGLYYLGWRLLPAGTANVVDPPALFPNGLQELQPIGNQGTLIRDGVVRGSANFTYEIRGEDRITVPAGTFDNALQVRVTLTGTAIDDPFSETWWFVRGVGIVRIQATGSRSDLVATNLLF